MRNQKLILPKKTILALVAGVLVLGVVGFLLLFPVLRDMNRLDRQIARAQTRLAVKKELYPDYSRLLKMQQTQEAFRLIPYEDTMTREKDISTFGNTIASLCTRTGMDYVAATPSPESISGAKHMVLVDVVIRGDFLRFREFLLQLLQVPSLVSVQQIKVRSIPEDREYGLKLWVGLH
ncbi:hypothetical protein [Desulfoplanes formicivorans]|uniref:General secretion pathway protein M n=1 Tax=Desulfoplanes formicivorans TaxID=1592317 RepID=A0A194AFW3_9BACT|nr:hypothetical protein [Desulfoplanes formicivorans]GAU08972.1 hypothetical protein DPF_1691 [Desulfoplanes formicivorans]